MKKIVAQPKSDILYANDAKVEKGIAVFDVQTKDFVGIVAIDQQGYYFIMDYNGSRYTSVFSTINLLIYHYSGLEFKQLNN